MNMQEAAEHADKILDGTFAAIKPTVHWTHGESTQGSCDVSRRRAVMTVISEARRGSFLGVVERYWKSQGYNQIGANRSMKSPAMYFQTPDEFNVRLLIGDNGQAFFEVATPCVEKSSVSPPTSKTIGPNYAGKPIPDPNIHSDFWSSGGPSSSPSGS
ncbi:hypothetical protein AV521_44800 [Streptomyces sp. IMTB 2501]|uniref:hypothetical protein n=1 Tax=Streptomyces sp. IMTB 2501 TaxID=1776340 RepID=UPI00096D1CC4|nr:hypothetical protein [Streptomyces sp. IMTB 2501]OLZ60738.1 hypothetical protein AV521_44800 [Streptomyces sp. IMTB 2501]